MGLQRYVAKRNVDWGRCYTEAMNDGDLQKVVETLERHSLAGVVQSQAVVGAGVVQRQTGLVKNRSRCCLVKEQLGAQAVGFLFQILAHSHRNQN